MQKNPSSDTDSTLSYSRNSLPFIKHKDAQQPATGPYSELDEWNPYSHTISINLF
jgi:hypothetical protein